MVTKSGGKPDFSHVSRGNIGHCSLTYRYFVNQKAYNNNKISFLSPSQIDSNIEAQCNLLRKYGFPKEGDFIHIKYNPLLPSESVYIDEFPEKSLKEALIFIAVSLIVIAAVIKSGNENGST